MTDGTSPDMWGGARAGDAGGGRGAWLRDSRFAMFIHWGPYSALAGRWRGRRWHGISEWIMKRAQIPVAEYEQAAAAFNPVEFDAARWVELARAAGMRHLMITAKHHDGFAMFRSAASGFNIVDATAFGRDPMRELADACAAAGLRLGFYYSQTQDWHERDAVGNTWDWPAGGGDFERYLHGKVVPQLRELLTGYGPIAGVWFDTPGPITGDQSAMLVDLVHELQPDCLVNSRIGNGLGDYDTLGDQEIPSLPRPGLWETPDTHNDSWGFAADDRNFKDPLTIAERLVRVVSRGGSYLLNVGPDGLGRIPEASERVLRTVGHWLADHSAAIHGAGPSPLGPLPWGECTTSPGRLHLHLRHWPADSRLVVPGLRSPVTEAAQVGQPLAWSMADGVLTVDLPPTPPPDLVPVVTLTVAGEVAADGVLCLLPTAETVFEPGLAECEGCSAQTARWMEKFGDWQHVDCLGGWQGAGSVARWTCQVIEAGAWYLTVEYTCGPADDDAEWQVRCGDEAFSFPLIDTGERERRAAFGGALPRFRRCRLALLELPPGHCTLSLGPAGDAGLGMRLAAPRLSPVPGWGAGA